jgi:hypothetical protein
MRCACGQPPPGGGERDRGGIQATAVTRSSAVSAAGGEIEPNTASASSLPSGVSVTVPPADRPGPLARAVRLGARPGDADDIMQEA